MVVSYDSFDMGDIKSFISNGPYDMGLFGRGNKGKWMKNI